METVIVLLIVVAAGLWMARVLLARHKARACGSGCPGCGSNEAARPQPLVRLRVKGR